eukprot:6188678-Pleurochrysis_carterae.AAC.1
MRRASVAHEQLPQELQTNATSFASTRRLIKWDTRQSRFRMKADSLSARAGAERLVRVNVDKRKTYAAH